jgi:hypothetical protein
MLTTEITGLLTTQPDSKQEGHPIVITIRNCIFAFKCHQKWESMRETSRGVRFCTECQKEIFYCHTANDLVKSIHLNRCIAINTTVDGMPAPLVMGMPARYVREESVGDDDEDNPL